MPMKPVQRRSHPKDPRPVRSLIVYADGRVCEVPFRLSGSYYLHREDDGRQRMFRSGYAHVDADGPFTMVYTEGPAAGPELRSTLEEGPLATVNGTPVPVDVGVAGEDGRDVHARCVREGGHRLDHMLARETCSACGLDGRLIRMFEREGNLHDVSDLRDKVVSLHDENRDLLAENARLRRRLDSK